MGKVEMDISEYNQMQKNAELLETANKDLKKLHDENKKLQEEKIAALKENEHTVTVIEKKTVWQHAYTEFQPHEIHRNVINLLSDIQNGKTAGISKTMGQSTSADDFARLFLGCLYRFEQSESQELSGETVRSMPLEEMKRTMRAEAKAELDKEAKAAMEKVTSQGGLIATLKTEQGQNKELIEKLSDQVTGLQDALKDTPTQEDIDKSVERLKVFEEFALNTEYYTRVIPFMGGRALAKDLNIKAMKLIRETDLKPL